MAKINLTRVVEALSELSWAAFTALGILACSSSPVFEPGERPVEGGADWEGSRPRPVPPPSPVLCQPNTPCELPGVTAYTGATGVTLEVLQEPEVAPEGFEPALEVPPLQIGLPGRPFGAELKAVVDLQGLRVEPKLVVLFDQGEGLRITPVEFVRGSAVVLTDRGGRLQLAHVAPRLPPGCEEHQHSGGSYGVSTLAELGRVTHIKGDLELTGSLPSNLKQLACLTEISGALSIHDTSGLTSLDGLQVLTVVGGEIHIASNADLVAVDLPQLVARTGAVSVVANPKLARLKLPRLVEVGGPLTVADNGARAERLEIDLPALKRVSGDLDISRNSGWDLAQGLAALREVSGQVRLLDNDALTELLALDKLHSIGQGLEVGGNPMLEWSNGLSGLESIGGSVVVRDCPRLRALDLGAVSEIVGSLTISHNGSHAPELRVNLSSLRSVREHFSMVYNRGWTCEDGLPALQTIGGNFEIANNRELVALREISRLESIGGQLAIANNDQLSTIDGLSALSSVGQGVAIHSNPALSLVDLSRLPEINGPLIFAYNGTTSERLELDLSSVVTIWGRADLIHNGSWRLGTGLTRLRRVVGGLAFFQDRDLNQIALPSLELVEGTLDISNDPGLTFIGLDGLEQVAGDLRIHSHARLALLSLGALDRVEGSFDLSHVGADGPPLSASFPELGRIGGHLTINYNRGWQMTGALPSLQLVEGDVRIAKNQELLDLDLPHLVRIGGELAVTGNLALLSLGGLAGLRELGGDLTVTDNPSLPACEAEGLVQGLQALAWRELPTVGGNGQGACP